MPMKAIQSPYFATGDPETEEMTTLYAPGMLGCVAQFDRGGTVGVCAYQLVKQDVGQQVVQGNVLYWVNKQASTVTTVATNTGQLAGVAQVVSATPGSYIWIVKRGDRPVLYINAPTSAPDATGKPVVGVTATAGKADSLALATAPSPVTIGRSLGAADGTTHLGLVRINVLD